GDAGISDLVETSCDLRVRFVCSCASSLVSTVGFSSWVESESSSRKGTSGGSMETEGSPGDADSCGATDAGWLALLSRSRSLFSRLISRRSFSTALICFLLLSWAWYWFSLLKTFL